MSDDRVGHSHVHGFLSGVVQSQKEDLPCFLLTDLPRQERRTVAAVETGNVRICLFEDRVFAAREGHVADYVKTVTAAYGPTRYNCDDDLGHEANEALNLQDM